MLYSLYIQQKKKEKKTRYKTKSNEIKPKSRPQFFFLFSIRPNLEVYYAVYIYYILLVAYYLCVLFPIQLAVYLNNMLVN